MGASVTATWPGITEAQRQSMPGFRNDDRAWGNWMAEREDDPAVLDAIRRLKAEAILTVKTDGWDDDDVAWVSPAALRDAAARLRAAVEAERPETAVLLASYARGANGMAPVRDEFLRDLDDIVALAAWAEAEGAERMTLEVGW